MKPAAISPFISLVLRRIKTGGDWDVPDLR